MTKVLEMNNFAKTADCIVEISRDIKMDDVSGPTAAPVNAAPQGTSGRAPLSTLMLTGLMTSLSLYFLF